MEIELVNAFLMHETDSGSELMLKRNIQELNTELLRLETEKNEAVKKLASTEERYLKLVGAFENQLFIAEQIARSKGLEPVKRQQKMDSELERPESIELSQTLENK